MAVQPSDPVVGSVRRDRTQARHEAACAIQLAARSLGVEPAELGATAYRGFCVRELGLGLPSWLAISLLFVGWQRACEQVLPQMLRSTSSPSNEVSGLHPLRAQYLLCDVPVD